MSFKCRGCGADCDTYIAARECAFKDHIRAVVDRAPPLSLEQRATINRICGGSFPATRIQVVSDEEMAQRENEQRERAVESSPLLTPEIAALRATLKGKR